MRIFQWEKGKFLHLTMTVSHENCSQNTLTGPAAYLPFRWVDSDGGDLDHNLICSGIVLIWARSHSQWLDLRCRLPRRRVVKLCSCHYVRL